ncbi:MAG TPA: heparan-alpha-glucosaminide N-acetyltransferase domain-containing protein [Candidatus Angelobacter sp.]
MSETSTATGSKIPALVVKINDKTALTPSSTGRIASIDIVRGVVMLLMAIDHVRVYSGLPAGGPTAGIFLTRWITHFVAPAFIFLAGTSAFLHGRKLAGTRALARFLLSRGLWLVFLELTILRIAWTFNFDFSHYLLAGVIWVIGWCMVLLAGLIFLPTPALSAFGLLVVFGHNILDHYSSILVPAIQNSHWTWLAQILYFGGPIQIGEHRPTLFVLYSIIPWVGVMALGYVFGRAMVIDSQSRRRLCLALGTAAIALFLLLRGLNLYGDPRPWSAPTPVAAQQSHPSSSATAVAPVSPRRPQAPAWISFLNTNKYPASLLFLLMTLGPMFIALALLEHSHGLVADTMTMFGRVPFFYYALHIPLIHLLAVFVSIFRMGSVSPWLFANHPVMVPPAPVGYVWGLGLLYLVWVITLMILYFPCRWFAALKQQRKDIKFLSYL